MKSFNFNHPKDVRMGYIEHLYFTLKESGRSLVACIVMFIHGFIPCIFDWWYSDHIKKTKERLDKVNKGRIK